MKKRVVVFGIFDGVHDGHRSLFSQAKKYGDELFVIVGRDSASLKWKGKKPKHSQETRLSLISRERDVDKAVLGDEEQSSYKILEDINPDVICLGYDQDKLELDLKKWMEQRRKTISLYHMKPYRG